MQVSDEMVRAALTAYCGPNLYTPEESMRAALEAALAAMWRPIDEAPKLPEQGQCFPPTVRLWDGECERHGYFNDNRHARNPRPYWAYIGNDRGRQPTHFMPLSSAPNISARSSAGSEQPPSKRQVAGSNPAERASFSTPKREG